MRIKIGSKVYFSILGEKNFKYPDEKNFIQYEGQKFEKSSFICGEKKQAIILDSKVCWVDENDIIYN